MMKNLIISVLAILSGLSAYAQTPEFTARGKGLLQVYHEQYFFKQGYVSVDGRYSRLDRCATFVKQSKPEWNTDAAITDVKKCEKDALDLLESILESNQNYRAYTTRPGFRIVVEAAFPTDEDNHTCEDSFNGASLDESYLFVRKDCNKTFENSDEWLRENIISVFKTRVAAIKADQDLQNSVHELARPNP